MLKTHKIALDVNNKQQTHLAKCAGVARFAYNWALTEWKAMYEAHLEDNSLPKPGQMLLRRNLNAVKRKEQQLRREQQSLSRKQKGSSNYQKQRMKVARKHAEASDTRSDFLHKMTTAITDDADVLVIEDLNVKGMLKNKYLSKSIADASFGEFRRQMTYKADEKGKTLIISDRFYPSSKLCSACGAKTKHLTLSVREWVCNECGTKHDRDVNAAINLKKYAESLPVSACGEFSASARPASRRSRQAASEKQELNGKPTP